jgi:hypothetical protein
MPRKCKNGYYHDGKECVLKYNYYPGQYNKDGLSTKIYTQRNHKCKKGYRQLGKSGKCANKRLRKMTSKNKSLYKGIFGKSF